DFKTNTTGTGQVTVQSFIQLRDPNKLIPFNIIKGNTPERLLTGADFDPESMQRTSDGTYWIGDECGPYLLHFSADGVLLDAPI
ncbi:esterase-like activity of phytase family protein, partial [Acinetobacter baumannii]|uniref:esterase-like activity of phytase family protein n=1 Tax=Acinetobacter baumannii TaxID=470 RepID=UPI003AF9A545